MIGSCFSCHDGVISTGKNTEHIASSDVCETCHSSTAWVPVTRVDHAEVQGTCISCHDGVIATGKGVDHIDSSDVCESCHSSTEWVPTTTVDHTQVNGSCVTCHDGIVATGKNVEHIDTSGLCEACHVSDVWVPTSIIYVKQSNVKTFFGEIYIYAGLAKGLVSIFIFGMSHNSRSSLNCLSARSSSRLSRSANARMPIASP